MSNPDDRPKRARKHKPTATVADESGPGAVPERPRQGRRPPGGMVPPRPPRRPAGTQPAPAAVEPPPFVVTGTVTRMPGASLPGTSDGSHSRNGASVTVGALRPIGGVVVRAFDKELRREVLIGEVSADARGGYSIAYGPAQLARPEKTAADLVVRVYDTAGVLLLASPVIFRARPREVVDLVFRDPALTPPTEFERHTAAMAPVLAGADLVSLSDDEIVFVAAKAGVSPLIAAQLAIAHRHAAATRIPAHAFYGLFRSGLPTRLAALLLQPTARVRAALERAARAGVVAATVAEHADQIIAALRAQVAVHVLGASETEDVNLRAVLAASGASPAQQAAFVTRYLDASGGDAAFWAALRADRAFGPRVTADLELAVAAGIITRDNPALIRAVMARHRQGHRGAARDLVRLSSADWEALIRTSGAPGAIAIPVEIAGDTEDARIAAYAADLRETVRAAFPTAAALTSLAAEAADDTRPPTIVGGTPARRDLARFLENVPDFELEETRLRTFFAEHGATALAGVADAPGLQRNLERVQRVFRIAPRAEHLETLLGAGLDSAHAIAAVPRGRFVREFGERLGGEAQGYHRRSSQISAAMKLVGTAAYQFEQGHDPYVLRASPDAVIKAVPSLEALFGTMNACECDQCRSVYGPASYLVDVLQFLRNSGDVPFDHLMARRPDLQFIDLTCENSDTPLPLIDLANEILEFYVAHGDFAALTAAQARALAKNTTSEMSPDELSLNPQYTYHQAYTTLESAVRAPGLPFDLWGETVRDYLQLLGSTRHEVMRTLQSLGTIDPAQPHGPLDTTQQDPSDRELNREALKLSELQWRILVGTSGRQPWELLAFSSAAPGGTSWLTQVAVAAELSKRAGVAYDDLVALVSTLYVNPGLRTGTIDDQTVVLYAPDNRCDLTSTFLQYRGSDHDHLDTTGLDAAAWMRVARFLRLWRTLGWTISDVDRALTSLGATEIDGPTIAALAITEQVRIALEIPVAEVISLWSPIDTFGEDSLYARLFQNQAVLNPVDDAFALAAGGAELAHTGETIAAHQAAVLAALRIGADDLDRLTAALGVTDLSLAALSALHRRTTLARALELSITDLLALVDLVAPELDPFTPGHARPAQRFVEIAQDIAESGFGVAEIAYVFRGTVPGAKNLVPSADAITALLGQLQDGLRKIVDETRLLPDPSGDLLRSKLGMVVDPTRVDAAMQLVEGTSTLIPDDQDTFIAANLGFLDADAAHAMLVGSTLSPEDRRAYVLPALLAHVRDSMSRGVVNQTLGGALGLDGAMVSYLLETALRSHADATRPAIDDYLALVGDGLAAAYYEQSTFDAATTPVVTRTDAAVSFFWDQGSPEPAVPTASFGARWRGYLVPLHGEEYTFYVRASDGARLWIATDLTTDPTATTPFIDTWSDATEHSAAIRLVAGQPVALFLDYHKDSPAAAIELSWSSVSTPKAVIPQSVLYTTPYWDLDRLVSSYLVLHRIAMLAVGFAMTRDEAVYISEHRDDFSGLHLAQLGASAHPWRQWDALRVYVALRDRLPAGDTSLLDVLGLAAAGRAPAALDALAELAGWSADDAHAVAAHLVLRARELRRPGGIERLREVFLLAQRMGVSARDLRRWATNEPSRVQAEDVVRAAKSRYDDAGWLTTAKPINDILRNQRRDALVAYVLSDPAMPGRGVVDADSLFEYLLIDVNMDACMMTSRIKQAMSSAQLFVQRCLMNLEPGIPPAFLDAERWAWMKNYRVWEANRKVFLYPENWIDPTLRSDKTPFFEELESQLLQGPLTESNLGAAITGYLHKLDDVARLEICGLYRQTADAADGSDIIHVIGRTWNPPHVYYYRQFEVATETWTAWQAVPLDIDGDHVIPAIFHRRLYLFWTSFEQKPDEEQDRSGPSLETDAHHQWELDSARYDGETSMSSQAKQAFTATLGMYNTYLQENIGDDDLNYYIELWKADAPGAFLYNLDELGKPIVPDPEPEKRDDSVHPAELHWEIKLSWAEYRDGGWSSKQSAETPLASYAHGGYAPQIADHFFRVDTDDELTLRCYRRRELSSDVRYRDLAWNVGHVTLDDCRAKMETTQRDARGDSPGDTELVTPRGSRLWHVGYREEPGTDELVLIGPKSQYKCYTLLEDTPQTWEVVPPAENPTPAHSTLGEVVYPFVFQDTKRVYLAHTVRESVPGGETGTRTPDVDVHYEAVEDPSLSRIKEIDPGYPVPETGRPVEALVVAGTGVATELVAGERNGIDVPGGAGSGGGAVPFTLTRSLVTDGVDAESNKYQSPLYAPEVTTHLQTFVRFHGAFHPHVCAFIEALHKDGVDGLFTLANQRLSGDPTGQTRFAKSYEPTSLVSTHYPLEDVDFGTGAYSVYNWELFFHIPLLVAVSLMNDQQYEAAQTWFHYIFDPTASGGGVENYWKVLPFHDNTNPQSQQIVQLLEALAPGGNAAVRTTVLAQIQQWRDNPFDPFLLARLRITAFQKTVVIKYVQNLIGWGDQLFARDTIESINEATQLYVLASHILGERPEKVPPRGEANAMSYHQLRPHLDGFSNAWVTLENEFPFSAIDAGSPGGADEPGMGTSPGFYFCIPANDDLLTLWDTVADRLFKVRNCMNLGGVARQLPLFEPPIDPALLVRATALGLDLGSVLDDVNSPLGPYRFSAIVQKASELCAEVKALGGALLGALEKKDGETLALLRAGHELAVLKAVRDLKAQQIDEANTNIESLDRTRLVTEQRQTYYQGLVDAGLLAAETTQLTQLITANSKTKEALNYELAAQGAAQIPNAAFGTSGSMSSPVLTAQFGGSNLTAGLSAMAKHVGGQGATASYQSRMSEITAGHVRRAADWQQQIVLATKELDQIAKQIAAAKIRAAIAQLDHDNQELQIENSEAAQDYLRTKYTNQDLYSWMLSKISAAFFQAYSAAYDLAKKAEKAYRYELGVTTSNFISFGYWDSLQRGLLAGDQLAVDLKRMEAAFLDQNRRELEISKEVSLAALDPLALLELRETGTLRNGVELPEAFFDADYPGHYMRRLKNVSLSIPCVVGPYTSVNCTLTLLSSKVRTDPTTQRPYEEDADNPDPRISTTYGARQSIATSRAQGDSGLFELNFRDERYLPFEGAGACSTWRIDLPKDCNGFDFRTISDVIIHVKYTARDGGAALRSAATNARTKMLASSTDSRLSRWFSLRHDFPDDWHRFLHPVAGATELSLGLDLGEHRFPFQFREAASISQPAKKIRFTSAEVFLALAEGGSYTSVPLDPVNPDAIVGNFAFTLEPPSGTSAPGQLRTGKFGLPYADLDLTQGPGDWRLGMTSAALAALAIHNPALCHTITVEGIPRVHLEPGAIDDMWVVFHYVYK